MLSPPSRSRLLQAVLVGFGFLIGYVIAGWWWRPADTSPLSAICARIDYIEGLQKELEGQQGASKEVKEELKKLVEQCEVALGNGD